MTEKSQIDILLVGGGIMSATLGTLLNRFDPALKILMVERLEDVALESSNGWNNAGTGHAGYCELNYTPEDASGRIHVRRALDINAAFELSLQLWSSLVEQNILPAAPGFINATPHISFVWGRDDVAFLRQRHRLLSAHPLFSDMRYSEDIGQLQAWMPLVMQARQASTPYAATRLSYGTDVDFGALTRCLIQHLQQQAGFELRTRRQVTQLRRLKNQRWQAWLDHGERLEAGFVFLGAGGGTLPLLQKSGIEEGRAYGGFPVSGQWLVCNNPEIVRQHQAKVYGKAPLGAPPMSAPHLDTRIIHGQPALLFGPYAGFTTRFLKRGSLFDLAATVKPSNLKPMLAAGARNLDLTRYLIGEALQSHPQRMQALRKFYPTARDDDWKLASAGKRVQIIKHCAKRGGRLEFGTEIVAAADGSLAALLGASPGASTSVAAMLNVVERCFRNRLQQTDWQTRLQQLIPSYGRSLIDDPQLLREVRARTQSTLGLQRAI